MAVNAWYLLPDLAYYSDTLIVGRIDEWQAGLRVLSPALEGKYLYSVNRTSAIPGGDFIARAAGIRDRWVLIAACSSSAGSGGTSGRARWRSSRSCRPRWWPS